MTDTILALKEISPQGGPVAGKHFEYCGVAPVRGTGGYRSGRGHRRHVQVKAVAGERWGWWGRGRNGSRPLVEAQFLTTG